MTLQWDAGARGDTAKVDVIVSGHRYAVTYHASTLYGVFSAWLIAVGPRGGRRRLDLGHFRSHEQAKQACEQHYAKGCDLKDADQERRW